MTKKKTKKIRFDVVFFSLGFIFLALALFYNSYAPKVLSFASFPETPVVVEKSEFAPKTIVIEKIGVNLPIQYASIQDGVWDINDTSAMYLAQSPLPGEDGTTVIYAHNKTNLFGKLKSLQRGDEIRIKSKNEEEKVYSVRETFTVNPSDVWVLDAQENKELTLYTCTGFLDSKRFVVKANIQ